MIAKFTQRFVGIDWLPIIFAGLAVVAGAIGGLLLFGLSSPIFIFAGIIGIVGAVVVIANPEWGLIGLVVITYANLSDVLKSEYGIPSIAQPYIILLCATIAARWVIFNERPRGWKQPLALVSLYGFVTFLSLFYAQSYTAAQNGFSDFVKVAITTILIAILLRRGDTFHKVIWALIGVGLFLGIISVIQSITGTYNNNYGGFARPPVVNVSDGESTERIAGPIGDPNFYAQVMLVVLPLALDRLWNSRSQFGRIIAGASLIAVVLTVLFTFSRGAFVAMVIVLAIMFVGRRIHPFAYIATPLVLAALLQFAPANYTERLSTLIDFLPGQAEEGTTDTSFRGRSSEAIAAVMMFSNYPLLGVGVGNYNVRYLEYSRVIGLDNRLENRSAHSLYLEIAAERGLFGLTAFGILIGVMFYNLYRTSRDLNRNGQADLGGLVKALSAGLIGYMITSIFLHDSFPRYFWLLVGICLALPHIARYELAKHTTKQLDIPAR